jgi:hypothetical protein
MQSSIESRLEGSLLRRPFRSYFTSLLIPLILGISSYYICIYIWKGFLLWNGSFPAIIS